jgi:thiol-disulfide isomerase/thioredoxin
MRNPGGSGTVLNVWASWCDPCREEFPALLRAAREEPRGGARLMLVSADFPDQEPAIRKFLTEQGVGDSIFLKTGDDQEFINTLDSAWTGSLPATFVFDRSGRRVDFWEGKADERRFREALRRARS